MRRETRKWSPKKSRLCSSQFEEDQVFHRQAGQEEAEGHCWAYHFPISTTLVSKEKKEMPHGPSW
ncbi:hypothetical protein UPYG_G00083670 [Umbra pygmaea]|uniref:Uncharacterized protein n=1 Tax=Umbra pygmaea TaxID=75934 RepID=A0ABD0XEC7_UMBPY